MHGDLIDLHILLDHHLLKCFEVVDAEDLLHDAMMGGVPRAGLASRLELLTRDTHFCDEFAKELVNHLEEVLRRKKSQISKSFGHRKDLRFTYHMDSGVLELVLFLIIEDEAMLLNETHHGCLPSWTLKDCN